jgi:ABC-type spermidine/putrescine transport system permease subunit I
MPSLAYQIIFFLGAMAILVAFSFATQTGFNEITYGFSLEQYKAVLDPTYIGIFVRTLAMAY